MRIPMLSAAVFAGLGLSLMSASLPVAAADSAARVSTDWLARVKWVDRPALTAADLKDKVVLVEFWTFGCVNCQRTVPAMRELATRYAGTRDVVILGIHSPEFDEEKKLENVRRAIVELKLPYAVAQDNDFAAWNAFHNRYWPALYVLGRDGTLRATHVGELHLATKAWTDLLATVDALRKERG